MLLRDWGLTDLDATRAALGLEPLGGTSELSRTIVLGERSAIVKTLWQEAVQTDSPGRDDFVAAILGDAKVDVWCCYLEGLHIDPPSIKLAGFPGPEKAVGPALLEALVSAGTTAEVMETLAKFARRCLEDRTALPRPLNDSPRLWAALLNAGTGLAPNVSESTALEALDEVALEIDKVAKGSPDRMIAAFISALPALLREKRLLMLMNHSFDSGGYKPSGHRYAELAPTKRVATQALTSIEGVVKGGMFGTMGARTKKRRRELRDGNGALWARVMVSALAPRLLDLAQEPILFDKHDDRDVFASMLAQLTPPAATELVVLLDDKVKAIRTIALDGLKRCSSKELKPHLEFLRSSRKKNHRSRWLRSKSSSCYFARMGKLVVIGVFIGVQIGSCRVSSGIA